MTQRKARGTLALIGGGEFTAACNDLDRELAAASGAKEVVVLPTAAAFEHPDRVVAAATGHFAALGLSVRSLPVMNRRDAQDEDHLAVAKGASFVYIVDGSPLHLRSVLWDSPLFEALRGAYQRGAVIAASGAGATLMVDPMVDPRGGAYTVGLGLVGNLAVFPYHGTAADHLRERSIELLPPGVVLAGVDEGTAMVRGGDGAWRVVGAGEITLYADGAVSHHHAGPLALDR